MIHFVTPRLGTFGLFNYIGDYSPYLAERIRPLSYEDLAVCDRLPAGSYVFAALDQLTPAETEMVHAMRAVLARTMPRASLLNDPARVLLRAPLLERLHEHGRNEFRAEYASRDYSRLRFPLFVREANQHTGSLTPVLANRSQLERALLRLRLKGHSLDELLVVEFCDTANEHGLYVKYSAFIVGTRVIPRSVTFSKDWITKHGSMVLNDEILALEYDYIDKNPHNAWLAETFAIAGIDYGRIDYALRDGRPQVWEINTNPTVARGPRTRPRTPELERARLLRRPARAIFDARFQDAWAAIDCDLTGEIPWRIDDALRHRITRERRARQRRARRIARRERIGRFASVRALVRPLKR